MEKERLTRYLPVSKWNKYHEWPSVSGLRNLIYIKHKNGFDKVVKKVGKTVLLDEAAFFEWIENQNKKEEK